MMDQTHIGYTYWQEPPRNTMPRVEVIDIGKNAEMGVDVVEAALPTFDVYQQQTYHVDVYNKGKTPFEFTARADQPWVTVSPARGTIDREQRVAVSIDWSRAPIGERSVQITFTGPNNGRAVVQAKVSNPAFPKRGSIPGFIEGNGYVSIEAEHYGRAVASPNRAITWLTIPGFGKTLSGVTAMPVTAPSQTPGGSSPHLEYPVFLFDSGSVKVNVLVSPTLDFSGSKAGLRYALSFDDQPPQVVNVLADTSSRAWAKRVADEINSTVTEHSLAHAGAHVLKFWMVDPGVVLQKIVIEAHDISPSYLGPPESYHRAATSATSLSGAPSGK